MKKTFFDPWESADKATREQVMREKLAAYVNFAREQSPFYRDRLSQVDLKSSAPLEKVPFLVSQDLRGNLPPQSTQLLTSNNKGYTVFQSGGTTGQPKTSLFTNEELELLTFANARGFHAVGLQPSDRVANFWASGGLYMTFIHMNRFLQQSGCTSFPFTNHTAPDFVHSVTRAFNINVFTGISSVVLDMFRQLKALGLDGVNVRKVYFGAEHLYQSDLDEMCNDYGVETIKAPGYGTVDSWYIGYQCEQTPLGIFHAHDDQAYIEILDEESQMPVAPGQAGMLFVTSFPRMLTPIIRYRVGDRARWLNESCRCGRTTPLFQLLGRGDDILRIGYDSIEYESVQKLVAKIKELSGTLQMEKTRVDGRDELIIRVETALNPNDYLLFAQKLADQILQDRPTVRGQIAKGSVNPIRVELTPLGSLPRNLRTGKLIRVIDAIKE